MTHGDAAADPHQGAYSDGWNAAVQEIYDRLLDAGVQLRGMINQADANSREDDRLRGKLQGVELAGDYARGMKRT